MIRIGVFGAKDSLKSIATVAQEYTQVAEFTYYPYEHKEDTPDLVQQNLHNFDVALFSGRVPYNIVTSAMSLEKPSVYVPHNGSSIYRTLWDIKEAGYSLEHLSFDTIDEHEIREILKELSLSDHNVHVYEYDGDIDYAKLADVHVKHWEKNHNYVAVTCLLKTSEILKLKGIPSFRVALTKSLIRQVIESAINKATHLQLRANQLAIIIVDIDHFKKHIKRSQSEYELQRLKLKFNEKLLNFAEEIQGALFTFGSDEYLIFTTGGALEEKNHDFYRNRFFEMLENELDIQISMGIGYGRSAYEAENNGRIALHHAKESGGNCAYSVDQNKVISGPLNSLSKLSFHSSISDSKINTLSAQSGINAKNISKLISMIEKIGNTVSSKEIAYYLNLTDRSARRILATLHETGLAEQIGETNETIKGRPRALYKLNL